MSSPGNYGKPMADPTSPRRIPSSPRNPKEVDYYLNPTELFRWINYRRWDGARARAQSHPDECDTWIVSRHSSDGRILWRHLPLHLVCMQREAASVVDESDDPNAAQAARQIESLIDVLLDSYPEGASSPDDQGMLPLHLLLTKAENEPNERVINLLLTSFPNAVDVQDKFGRTPYDILREQSKDGSSERCRAAFRALKRARFVSDRITATIRDESANIVAAVQHEASNERGASQKIIVRLEEELSHARKQLEERDLRDKDGQAELRSIKDKLSTVETKLDNSNMNLDVTRKERDELLNHNETMRNQLDSHEEEVEKIRREAERNRQSDLEQIANLKSEVSTSKAMTEALESQLRSRFTNEEYLSTSVSDLEEQLEELKVRYEHATKKAQHELESLNADNARLKWNADEMSKKNSNLQNKLNDLTKQMGSIISSHSSLSSEHDRLIEIAERQESDLLEAIRTERSQLVDSLAKQRQALEKAFAEQERIIESSLKTEDKLINDAKQERARGKDMVEKLRKEFQDIRAAAAERERQLHAEALATNRKLKGQSSSLSPNPSSSTRNSSGPINPPPESRNPPSNSHRSPSNPRSSKHLNSSSNSTDGHLVRLLDERAAQNGATESRRGGASNRKDHSILKGPSSSDSSTEDARRIGNHPPYYIGHPIGKTNGRGHLPKSMSGSTQTPAVNQRHRLFDERSEPSKGEYSLDEYSHASETSNGGASGYSDSSSGYGNDGHRAYTPGGRTPPQYRDERREVRRDYGRPNLQYISESYGDESTME